MKKLLTALYTWCLLLLLGCGVLLLVTAPKEATISETENRMLEAFPKADAQSLLSGAFSSGFERYLSDRFFERDRCISLSTVLKNSLSLLSDADALKLAAMDVRMDDAPEEEGELPSDLEPLEHPLSKQSKRPSRSPQRRPLSKRSKRPRRSPRRRRRPKPSVPPIRRRRSFAFPRRCPRKCRGRR